MEWGSEFRRREDAIPYMGNFGLKKDVIGGKNSYFWNDSYYIPK